MRSTFLQIRKFIFQKLEKSTRDYKQRAYNNLDKLYEVIRPGDILLVEGRSEMSRIIKLFSNSHWSHASMYVGDALVAPDCEHRDFFLEKFGENAKHLLVEAFSSEGVIASPLARYKDYNIRICRPHGILQSDLKIVVETVVSRLGLHYDDQNIIDMAWLVLRSLFQSRNKHTIRACLGNCNNFQVICSGMIAQAFQSVGYPIVPSIVPRVIDNVFDENNPYGGGLLMRHYTQISPKDFDLSPNFEIIKFNIIGSSKFDYKSLWVEKI